MALSYYEQLKHPLWQKKKAEIMNRDEFKCTICNCDTKQLSVHHLCYFPDTLIWEYDNELMQTVCFEHHNQLTYDIPKIAGIIAFNCIKNKLDLNTIIDILNRIKL